MSRNSGSGEFELLVAALLRRKRIELGIPQTELCKLMKTNRKTVADLESGYIHIKLDHLALICPALGITVTELIQQAERLLAFEIPVPSQDARVPPERYALWLERKLTLATKPGKAKKQDEPALPVWLGGFIPQHLKEQHAASADELRRRNQERDSEVSAELCETHQE